MFRSPGGSTFCWEVVDSFAKVIGAFSEVRGRVEPPTFGYSDVRIDAGEWAANAAGEVTRAIGKLDGANWCRDGASVRSGVALRS